MSSAETDRRIATILSALRGLSPAELQAAAQAAPPPLSGHLVRLAAALAAPDPEAALAGLLDALAAAPKGLGEQLGSAEEGLQGQLSGLKTLLETLGAPLDNLTLPDALPDDLDDPDLAAILTEALQLSGGTDLAEMMREAIAEGSALSDDLAAAISQARRDPEQAARTSAAIQDRIQRLTDTLTTLETSAEVLPSAMSMLDRLRRLAAARQHPVAAEIAVAEAALWDAAGDQPPRILQARWRAALDLALRHQALPIAQQAAQRLQLRALSRRQPLPAATAAADIATLARAVGDRRAEVLALLEEALILAGVHERRDDALMRLRGALARAAGHPALSARVRLSAGQTLEKLGEHGEARRAWRELLKQPDCETAFPAEYGRARLYIGRQEARTGRMEDARANLTAARNTGRNTDDWLLYAPALIALLKDRVAADDITGAGVLIREARILAPRGGPKAVEALEGMVDFLRGRWGTDAVDAATT